MSATDQYPVDLVIHEPIGDLLITLEEQKIHLIPSNSFKYAIAERMGRASASPEPTSMIDRFVAKVRGVDESKLTHFFGEFSLSESSAELRDDRLHLHVGTVKTSFGRGSFDMNQALHFVRQLDEAKQDKG